MLFDVLKIKLKQIIDSDFNLKLSPEEESEFIIRQETTPLTDQLAVVNGYQAERLDDLIVLDGKKDNKKESYLKRALRQGFIYNGAKFVRFGKSSSQAKDGITVFIKEVISKEMQERSCLGLHIKKDIISKFESYRCLILSSYKPTDCEIPYIVIIDEFEKTLHPEIIRYVDDVKSVGKDGKTYNNKGIKQGKKAIKLSPFDGFGIHTPEMSKYLGIATQVRGLPFIKGMSVEVDFKKYYRDRPESIEYITDWLGNIHRLDDIDCIWNTSMFKGHKLFKKEFGNNAWNEYVERVKKYQFKLGKSKEIHHTDNINVYARMNFQYLQCLDLWNPKYIEKYKNKDNEYDILDERNHGKIINLAKYTTNMYEKIINGDKFYTYKFLGLNDHSEEDDNEILYSNENDEDKPKKIYKKYSASKYINEAILINDAMLNDPYIQKTVIWKLNNSINQMKYGKIYVPGFYHIVIGDIMGYLEYAAGLEVKGCLNAGEFYAKTVPLGKCASFRSPLVDPSEVNIVDIVENELTNKYLSHFANHDICMINMYDLTLPQQGGMDEDGDAVMLCYEKEIIDSKIDLPIVVDTEDKVSVKPVIYNDENILDYELKSRDSRIGEITNIATSILNKHTENEEWKKINAEHIALLRILQGKEIDYVKTGVRLYIPKYLHKYKDVIPYFQLYLYPKKLKKYKEIQERNKKIEADNEKAILVSQKRGKVNPIPKVKIPTNAYHSPSPMNELCDFICKWESKNVKWNNRSFIDKELLINNDADLSNNDLREQIRNIYDSFNEKYKKEMDKIREEKLNNRRHLQNFYTRYNKIDKIFDSYKIELEKIGDNIETIANYLIDLSYETISANKVLCWSLFGNIIVDNLRKNTSNQKEMVIVKAERDDKDTYEFLGKFYKLVEKESVCEH
ncbi:hypothetical protein SAMN04487895_10354 [Paenibacillus sophorae]|uniref:RNA dependent RNA polymerase n=1 Tax=Paenibacillus sophorae TaxID=1333845 RepID=A0A1H8JJV3_9BACL|nr:hypothetical protein [Paenibacillus sophorae]QWU13388.1 hypothetical protein KP014_15415 [Paenibacillus sophorae]SEN81064.1 hypothetical protein SAMN04487895_10354 [Paenibacillus sophorae]